MLVCCPYFVAVALDFTIFGLGQLAAIFWTLPVPLRYFSISGTSKGQSA